MLITVAQWAAQERISVQAANKRIRQHGIPRHGSKIDSDEAKAKFESQKDVRQQERGAKSGKVSAPPPRQQQRGGNQDLSSNRPAIQTALDATKLKREQLKLKQLEGSLVDAEQIKSETESRFRADAEALLNWPARIAAEFAAELGDRKSVV